jgi:hypothetical protein
MDCHDAKERILEGRETAAVRRHIDKCGDCASFVSELAAGGREISEAYLAAAPSPAFEDRVAARIAEKEITARPAHVGLLARLVAPVLFLGLVLAGYLLFWSSPPPTQPVADAPALKISASRKVSEGPTLLALDFAGESRFVPLAGGLEREAIFAWVRGARTVELEVDERVPFREVAEILETLERTGFGYQVSRPKT